jgi:hypothetical protein
MVCSYLPLDYRDNGTQTPLGKQGERELSGISNAPLNAFRLGFELCLQGRPLSPLPYRSGMLRVMAVSIDPKAMAKAGLSRELVLGRLMDAFD